MSQKGRSLHDPDFPATFDDRMMLQTWKLQPEWDMVNNI
jgi:hypothetical protein